MKILLSYVFVVSVGLMTVSTAAKAQENIESLVVHLSPLPLGNDDFSMASRYTDSVIEAIPNSPQEHLQSIIYLAKLSEAIDATMNSRFYQKNWKSDIWISMNTDMDKPSTLSCQVFSFRHAPLNVERPIVMRGKHDFSPDAKAFIKLPYRIKGIGEYHRQRTDGTFAVFR